MRSYGRRTSGDRGLVPRRSLDLRPSRAQACAAHHLAAGHRLHPSPLQSYPDAGKASVTQIPKLPCIMGDSPWLGLTPEGVAPCHASVMSGDGNTVAFGRRFIRRAHSPRPSAAPVGGMSRLVDCVSGVLFFRYTYRIRCHVMDTRS